MTADDLIRLYPRSWRARYGEEFLETVGHEALHLQQVVDIVAGAIDAWLSSEVRRGTRQVTNQQTSNRGAIAMNARTIVCHDKRVRFTKRDGLIGNGVMIAGTIIFLALGIFARRNGWPVTGEIMKSLAFPASMTLSMPFWMLKGQPWRAQAVLVGGTLIFLIGIGYLSTLI